MTTARPSSSSVWGREDSHLDAAGGGGGFEGLSSATRTHHPSYGTGGMRGGTRGPHDDSSLGESSASRSCLVLPLAFRRTNSSNSSNNHRTNKNRLFSRQKQEEQDTYKDHDDPDRHYQKISWERFPYDYNYNNSTGGGGAAAAGGETVSASGTATPKTTTTATTAASTSWMSSTTTVASRRSNMSMNSRDGGGGGAAAYQGFGYTNMNGNTTTNSRNLTRDASPVASNAETTPHFAATSAAAPPSTTSSSSSSSSRSSNNSSRPRDRGHRPEGFSPTASSTTRMTTMTTTTTRNVSMEHLLTPPTPKDRASVPKRRQAYEQEQRQKLQQQQLGSSSNHKYNSIRRGLYDGEICPHGMEMEPEGIRGQEAEPASSTTAIHVSSASMTLGLSSSSTSPLPNMRSFAKEQPGSATRSFGTPTTPTTTLASIREVESSPVMRLMARSSSPLANEMHGSDDHGDYDHDQDDDSRSSSSEATPPPDDVQGSTPAAVGSGEHHTGSSSKSSSLELYKEFVPARGNSNSTRLRHTQERKMPPPPMQFHPSTGQAVRGCVSDEAGHEEENDHIESTRNKRRENLKHQRDANLDDGFDSDSTQSDDELRQMQADLIPNPNTSTSRYNNASSSSSSPASFKARTLSSSPQHHEHSKQRNNNTNMQHRSSGTERIDRPSPVAAAAAATAARTTTRRSTPKSSSSPSLSSSHEFWNTNRPPSHHHSHEEDMSHSEVDVVRTYSTADADQRTEKETKEDGNDSTIDALNVLAMEYVHRNEFGDAIATFMQVLKRQKATHGDLHPAVASAYHNLGTVHAKRVAALQRQLEEQQQQRSTPNTIGTAPTPVVQLEREQRAARQAALEAFQAAARTARDSLSTEHPNVAVSLVRIGFLLLQSRQYQNAVITFEEALRIRLAYYGPRHALVANLYNNLGVCHMHLGNFVKGRLSLLEGLSIQRELVQSSGKRVEKKSVHWLELADTLFNLGGLCLEWIRKQGPDLRRVEEAENSFGEALQIRTRVLGPDDPSVHQLQEMLSMAASIPRPRPLSTTPSRNQDGRWPNDNVVGYGAYKPITTRGGTHAMDMKKSVMAANTADFSGSASPTLSYKRVSLQSNSLDPLEVSSIYDANPPTEDAATNNDGHSHSRIVKAGQSIVATEALAGIQERRIAKDGVPPVSEVRVSTDDEDFDLDRTGQSHGTAETRIYMAAHLVPDSPTSRRNEKNDSQEAVVTGRSFEETLDLDSSNEIMDGNRSQLPQSFPYDAEENCMINDSGVDTEHCRVHYPLTWNKVGVRDGSLDPTVTRDIVVTRPFRVGGTGSVASNATDASYSTGNTERDDVMARARAILDAHSSGQSLKPFSQSESQVDSETEGEDAGTGGTIHSVDYLIEDGLAPLGGSWSLSRQGREKQSALTEMLADPMNHLPEIHEEASKLLLAHRFEDALPLFSIVLQCQRKRNGPVHADVAASLHNVGICHLRAQNHDEALQAFLSSARIRKGVLGAHHHQVAISLVKAGITLLLLRRFDDALWSFREALSVRKHALGPLHPSVARIYNNIGCCHVEFNEFKEARRAFEAALDIQRSALCHDPGSGPLLFGAATTLCNLGYLYRYRDFHEKAQLVLKEAVDLQEEVLGTKNHPTVLSTMDNLADSCAHCGQLSDALRFYNIVLKRFRVGGRTENLRAEAVLLYKMSRVYRQRNDYASQLDLLKLALRSIRAYSDTAGTNGIKPDTLERRILYDIRACREKMEKDELNWV